jgi:outer membrane PBP1 activator LpoA protein
MILLILGLWGCSGAPEQKSTEPTPPPVEQPQKPGISLTLPHSEFSVQFNSAEQSLARFDWMAASVALRSVPPQQLTPDDRTYLGYLEARIAYSRGYQAQALAQLEQLTYPKMNTALQYRILNFRHHIVQMSGDNLQSAQLADQILRWAPAPSAAALKRGIWRDLQRVDTRQLQTAMSAATDPQWRGWLELALISRDNYRLAINNLSDWRNNNAGHPAATPLPGGLDYLLQQTPPLHKVALILPLSGRLAPAGKAVRDGYLANYYAARAAGQGNYEVLLLDMDKYESANSAYDDALRQGANLVVGPLSKQAVAELGTRLERPIPVLALNRIDQVLPATGSALVQLSLAPEDEAERIAELAFGQGARAALIVRPAGSWGNKVQQALQARWAALLLTVSLTATGMTIPPA